MDMDKINQARNEVVLVQKQIEVLKNEEERLLKVLQQMCPHPSILVLEVEHSGEKERRRCIVCDLEHDESNKPFVKARSIKSLWDNPDAYIRSVSRDYFTSSRGLRPLTEVLIHKP